MLAWDEFGARTPERPSIVLLHAFPLNRQMWKGVATLIAAQGWHVLVPDLPGFGESDAAEGPARLGVMAQSVRALLEDQSIDSFVLGGLSMGGYVAMEMMRDDSAGISAVMLADTKASADNEQARENRFRVAQAVRLAGDTRSLAAAMVPGLVGATTLDSRPEVVEQVRNWILATPAEAVAWAQEAMAARPDSHRDLDEFSGPVLILWGSEDGISPVSDQHAMLASLTSATFVDSQEIPGCGHLSAVEDPVLVANAVLSFLAGLTN